MTAIILARIFVGCLIGAILTTLIDWRLAKNKADGINNDDDFWSDVA